MWLSVLIWIMSVYRGGGSSTAPVTMRVVSPCCSRWLAWWPPGPRAAQWCSQHSSLAFVEEAAAAGRRVVANINIDDVGHLSTVDAGRPSLAALHGKSICLELYNIVRARGNENGIEITDIDHSNLFTHSDHYSFYRAGIPVLDFGAGFLSDWLHTPEDDPDAMDGHQLQQVATVVYESVRTIAEHIDMCKSR
jgi:Zn-dependent M28 family amino/carboxypeptidase